MEFQKIILTPSAEIRFTEGELRVLAKCSKAHYDGICKSMTSPDWKLNDRENYLGLILKMINWHRNDIGIEGEGATRGYPLQWRQIDALTKVCEVAQYLQTENLEDAKIGFGMMFRFKRILSRLNDAKPDDIMIEREFNDETKTVNNNKPAANRKRRK